MQFTSVSVKLRIAGVDITVSVTFPKPLDYDLLPSVSVIGARETPFSFEGTEVEVQA